MPNALGRTLLFLSSYFPLFLIFAFLQFQDNLYLAVALIAIGLCGLLGMLVYLAIVTRFAPELAEATEVRRRDGDAIGYIATYVLPFLTISVTGWRIWVAMLFLFIVIGVVYVNSDMIHLNPMLNVRGYHLYEVVLQDGGSYTLIARRRRVVRGERLKVIHIGECLLLEKER